MNQSDISTDKPAWNAVFAIAFGVAGLIIAEFLPTGMLTPMAVDLRISQGMAGQAVTATSVFAVIASLLTAFITRNLDRRNVLLGLSFLLVSSNLMVALAPSFLILMIGRVLLGISLGGFWSMATSTAMRLVPEVNVPRAIAIIFGGSSFASVFAAPLSSFLGDIMGWRNVFLLAAAFSFFAFIYQLLTIPSLKPLGETKLNTIIEVFKKPQFSGGMLAVALVFCGHFAAFTYIRPFLEVTTGVGASTLSLILLMFGIANFVGTSFAGTLVRKNLNLSLILLPVFLFVSGLGLLAFGSSVWMTSALIFFWGIIQGPVSVVWSTWVARKAPEQAETAGGIFVASIQFSAAIGAMLGGFVFDKAGSVGVFSLSSASWLFSALVVFWFVKALTPNKKKNLSQAQSTANFH